MSTYLGTPRELDSYLKPAIQLTLAAIVAPVTVVLWWFQVWWWLPVPALVAAIAYEAFFWNRRDRPASLVIEPAHVTLTDALRGSTVQVVPSDVEVAQRFVRGTRPTTTVVLLATSQGPSLAIDFRVDPKPPHWPHDIDVDEADATLGGQAAILKAVAPIERGARQTFRHVAALTALREAIPASAWARTGLQVWQGERPPLSPFGFLLGPASGWMVLEGSTWALRRSEGSSEHGVFDQPEATSFERTLELLQRQEDGPEETLVRVGYLALRFSSSVRVVFPAPVAAAEVTSSAPEPTDLHCHAAEGAALVAHLVHAGILPAGWPFEGPVR